MIFKIHLQLHFSELITFCLSLIHSSLLLMIKLEVGRGSKWGWKRWEPAAAAGTNRKSKGPLMRVPWGTSQVKKSRLNWIPSSLPTKTIGNYVTMLEILLSILEEGEIKIQQAKVPSYWKRLICSLSLHCLCNSLPCMLIKVVQPHRQSDCVILLYVLMELVFWLPEGLGVGAVIFA